MGIIGVNKQRTSEKWALEIAYEHVIEVVWHASNYGVHTSHLLVRTNLRFDFSSFC